VDPDPYWESGSQSGSQIPDPDPGARKLRNFSGKMHFLPVVISKKILPLTLLLKKNLMNNTGMFDLI
jgi:hypothetical protein